MLEQSRIKSDGSFVRSDDNPGAILNINNTALEQYRNQKQKIKKLNSVENRLDKVESMLSTILEILNANNAT